MTREVKQAYYKSIGHSSHDVTGSCHLIRFKKYIILLDYGLYQTNDTIGDYKINRTRHKDIKPKNIDYIFISHIHADHCCMLPSLYKDGCTAQIIITKGSKRLLKMMLMDSVNIMARDSERYSKKGGSLQPLYNENDVDLTLQYVNEYEFNLLHVLNEDLKFRLHSANHIVHSAQITIEINDNNTIKKIGYTGDIGSMTNYKLFVEDFNPIEQVDLLIGECTYSDHSRVHKRKDRQKDIEKIATAVERCTRDKGKLLIPVFSLNRLEEVLCVLYEIYRDKDFKLPIIVDTPLGLNIANIWEDTVSKDNEYWHMVWMWENIQKPGSYKESLAWQAADGPMIIISSGGMLTAGRAVGWAQELMKKTQNYIMFCGFSSENSLASKIKNYKENPYIKIDGKTIKNNAQVSILNSFGSHADHDELLKYYSEVRYNKIALVHSAAESKIRFSDELKAELSKYNRTSRVIAVNQDTKLLI